jgi:glucose-6-phosphate 1-epimerase
VSTDGTGRGGAGGTPRLGNGEGGLPRLKIRHPCGSSAEVYLHGAHVTSWRDDAGRERLFLSSASRFTRDAAIRGGIPVIFPQFADQGPLPKHGFARTAEWTLASARDGSAADAAEAVLTLSDSSETRAIWPHAFTAELRITLDGRLTIVLAIRNTGPDALDFTAALHGYYLVDDVGHAEVHGLEGVRLVDKMDNGDARVEESSRVTIRGEVDRIYEDVPADVRFSTGAAGDLALGLDGFVDVVVWNPGAEKAAALADLGPGEFARFLCVEAAVAGQPIVLPAGETWTGTQILAPR